MRLTNRAVIYVPTKRDSTAFDRLTEAAGGATLTNGFGQYTMADGTIVKEPVNLIEVFYTDQSADDVWAALRDTVRELRLQSEESVLVIVNGQAELWT